MRLSSISPFLLAASLVATGCVDHDASGFFVSGHVAPSEGDCTLAPGNMLVSRGVFNASERYGYEVFPLYNNQLRFRGSNAPLRADTNGVQIEGAEIELRNAEGQAISFGGLPNPFTVSSSTYVPSAADETSIGQAVGNIMVIPPAYADSLAATTGDGVTLVIASVQVFGETTGGVDIEAREWLWPIDVCTGGCLFVCVPVEEAADAACCTAGQDFTCPVANTASFCL